MRSVFGLSAPEVYHCGVAVSVDSGDVELEDGRALRFELSLGARKERLVTIQRWT